MRIEHIHIEEFGNQSHCHVDDLSNRLNIIHATDDASRQSTVQFLRWMLFGNCDDGVQSHLRRTGGVAAGSLTLMQDGLRRTISRRDDGTRYGRLAVDGGDRYSSQTNHMVSLLGSVTQADFDHLFAPHFGDALYLTGLLRSAHAQGIDLATRTIPSERRLRLLAQIDQIRADLSHAQSHDTSAVADLRDRQRWIQGQIELAERNSVRRREELEAELRGVRAQAQRLHAELERCRDRWRQKDEEVKSRRAELDRTWDESVRARRQLERQLGDELAELDALSTRWHGVLADIQRRCEHLTNALNELEAETNPDQRAQRCHVAALAARVERLRADLQAWNVHPAKSMGVDERWNSLRERVARGLDELQSATHEVCETLQERNEVERSRAMHVELDQLLQCEIALGRWLKTIEQQRLHVADDLAAARRDDVSLVDADARHQFGQHHYRWDTAEEHRPHVPARLRAVMHSCNDITPIDPEHDLLLQNLCRERDRLSRELANLQDRCVAAHDQEQALRTQLQTLCDVPLDGLRRELAVIEQRLHAAERIASLQLELQKLQDEERSLVDPQRVSPVVEHASDLLQQLSAGTYLRVQIDERSGVSVLDAEGRARAVDQLDLLSRHDVHLSLCLAMVAALRRRGTELPLVLCDMLAADLRWDASCDRVPVRQDAGWASVLSRFASAGHQVLIVTGRRETRDLFASRDHRFVSLDRTVTVTPVRSDATAEERPRIFPTPAVTVDAVRFKRRPGMDLDAPQTDNDWEASPPVRREPLEPDVEPRSERPEPAPLNVIHWDTAIDRTRLVDDVAARHLRAAGLATVRQFLETDADQLDELLARAGLVAQPVRRWQDELELCCWLRDLPVEDARILVACGINDVKELSEADTLDLFHRVSAYHAANPTIKRSGRPLTLELVRRWADTAQHCQTTCRGLARAERMAQSPSIAMPLRDLGRNESADSAVHATNRSRADRANRRRRQTTVHANAGATSAGDRTTDAELRFYLNLEDPIVDAPSIGPRTAASLTEAGVRTIREFLQAHADTLAKQASSRRITAKLVRQWQAQANLACRVPNLRGHDAQILVACDVNDPDQLAAMDENELWSRVRPFVRTNEGKRIIRGGQAPDLEEVRSWIAWSQHARTLRAA